MSPGKAIHSFTHHYLSFRSVILVAQDERDLDPFPEIDDKMPAVRTDTYSIIDEFLPDSLSSYMLHRVSNDKYVFREFLLPDGPAM
jgi:hypothetical protein